jgi:hypothetical protein
MRLLRGTVDQNDTGVAGGNFLGTIGSTSLSASYCVSIDLGIEAPATYSDASLANDGTVNGISVPNAGAISWLLTNLGPTATTPVQQDALQAAIWRTEYGNGFQLDGVDNTNYAPDFNLAIASTYQADLAALGNNTAPVGNVLWITPEADTGQAQGLVALPQPASTPTPTSTPTPSTPRFARCSSYGPGFFGKTTADGTILAPTTVGVASKKLPLGTALQFLGKNGVWVNATVIDRGPFVKGRQFDLTEATVKLMGYKNCKEFGVRKVEWRYQ